MEIVYNEPQCRYGHITLHLVDVGEATEHLNMPAGEIKNHIDNGTMVYLGVTYDSGGATITESLRCDLYVIEGDEIGFAFSDSNIGNFYKAESMDGYPVLRIE